jgi:hypothetical protein
VRKALRLNERGRSLSDAGDGEGAMEAYRAAIRADASWSVPWYNLGLLHKYRGEWTESAECNLEAVRRDDSDDAAWWNLGIAATALGDWSQARIAWRRCGVAVPDGTGPIEIDLGLTPVRLDPETRGEVVWCERVDPARAIIRNVPLPESGYFYGDVLLHDGAPNGSRMLNGREVAVFDVLQRLVRSEFHTYILDLPGSSESERATLGDVAFDRGAWAEDWSQSVSFLCRRCSTGRPHDGHDSELRGVRPALAVAAAARDDEDVRSLIDAWRERTAYVGHAGFIRAGDDT